MNIKKTEVENDADEKGIEMTRKGTSGDFHRNNEDNDGDLHTEVPDLVKNHDAVRAEIARRKKAGEGYPPVKNALNPADSKVEHARETTDEWTINSPFKLEEFAEQSTPYRGQGLLPTDEMERGYRVKDKSKLSEPKYPAGKE